MPSVSQFCHEVNTDEKNCEVHVLSTVILNPQRHCSGRGSFPHKRGSGCVHPSKRSYETMKNDHGQAHHCLEGWARPTFFCFYSFQSNISYSSCEHLERLTNNKHAYYKWEKRNVQKCLSQGMITHLVMTLKASCANGFPFFCTHLTLKPFCGHCRSYINKKC